MYEKQKKSFFDESAFVDSYMFWGATKIFYPYINIKTIGFFKIDLWKKCFNYIEVINIKYALCIQETLYGFAGQSLKICKIYCK